MSRRLLAALLGAVCALSAARANGAESRLQHRTAAALRGGAAPPPALGPSGLLTVRSLRVAGAGAAGSKLFLGPPGKGFSIGTDEGDNFVVLQASAPDRPVLSLLKDDVLRFSARRVEAQEIDAVAGFSIGGVRQWQLARSEDFFQHGVGWSRTEVTQCGGVHMLGGYCKLSQGEVNKTFSGLPPHSQLRVVATYHFIDKWIGEAGYLKLDIGQERALAYVWNEQHFQRLSNHGVSLCGQHETPEGKFAAPVDVVVSHHESSLQLAFGSTMTGADACDGSWGVSGVEIYVRS